MSESEKQEEEAVVAEDEVEEPATAEPSTAVEEEKAEAETAETASAAQEEEAEGEEEIEVVEEKIYTIPLRHVWVVTPAVRERLGQSVMLGILWHAT